jgi:hypothetical protein
VSFAHEDEEREAQQKTRNKKKHNHNNPPLTQRHLQRSTICKRMHVVAAEQKVSNKTNTYQLLITTQPPDRLYTPVPRY